MSCFKRFQTWDQCYLNIDYYIILFCLQGVTFPAIQYMISKWSPPAERSRFATVYTGIGPTLPRRRYPARVAVAPVKQTGFNLRALWVHLAGQLGGQLASVRVGGPNPIETQGSVVSRRCCVARSSASRLSSQSSVAFRCRSVGK